MTAAPPSPATSSRRRRPPPNAGLVLRATPSEPCHWATTGTSPACWRAPCTSSGSSLSTPLAVVYPACPLTPSSAETPSVSGHFLIWVIFSVNLRASSSDTLTRHLHRHHHILEMFQDSDKFMNLQTVTEAVLNLSHMMMSTLSQVCSANADGLLCV